MANKKRIAANSKTKTSKYAKLMKAASKELADKKKALVRAEKALATATKNHQEIVQETARLDMLERSLRALVEGTEPPQNVRYVYTYPQWVWSWPNYYNTPNYTFTTQPNWVGYNTPNTGIINGGNFQGGSLLTSNGTYQSPTVTCTLANTNNGEVFTFINSNNMSLGTQATPCGSGLPAAGTVLTSDGSGNVRWTNAPSDGSLVVDLTTYEPYEDVPVKDRMPSEVAPDLVTA